jgi:membrane protease subunit HflC
MLRSLDTLDSVVSANTNLILRTDAAPFQALVQGPTDLKPESSSQAGTGAGPAAKKTRSTR